MAFKQDNSKKTFTQISISLASPEEILKQSHGEVLKPETINYRTYKPERDGLFCERIFGPTKDYECYCGKYKRIRYKGIVCDRCGVEVTEKKVRRERMGHIQLVVPVAHIWYFRSLPNKMGYLLGLPTKKLDQVIYYEKYIVIQSGIMDGVTFGEEGNKVEKNALLTEEEYNEVIDKLDKEHPENKNLPDAMENGKPHPDKFIAKMGAEAIYDMLAALDLDALADELRDKASKDSSQQRKTEALKRLNIVESFRASKDVNRPEWMILKILPVTPPELRPLVPLDGGRFATSDLNELYRRVIIRNNRLKRLLEIKAPEVILRNEKRMLQEAVDSLLDNSRKSTAIKSDANRPLKSLSDALKGKQGRFRQNLLGKRVDYSARSVIVVGPELKMNECGLPKDMAAKLYEPFIIRKLIERGIVKTVKSAKKILSRKDPVIWDILELVMQGHPVLLNRAPTLHRLGILAFQPRLIEGKAIQLHPLACTGFNADFDGDQMAVHLPLSNEAILEAQLLMLGSHNILNPANGAPITVPSQDMVLGLYYITKERDGALGTGLTFYSPEEAEIALNEKKVDMHAPIRVRLQNQAGKSELVQTTVGRLLVKRFVPDELPFELVNKVFKKSALRDIIGEVIKRCGVARTAQFLDDIKNLGYHMAFVGGLSFNLNDIIIPPEKAELVKKGEEQVAEIRDNYEMGLITNNERYNQVVDVWTHVDSDLTKVLMKEMQDADQGFNAVFMMMDSGARGSKAQIKQLSGMRGLMAKPQKAGAEGGQVIENPILANFKEGLSVLEYFISTHGARKGLADTALKTADAGYLTRRLVDVSHDVIVTEEDCGTLRGVEMSAVIKDGNVVSTLSERILGRVAVEDVICEEDYYEGEGEDRHLACAKGTILAHAGEEIREDAADMIEKVGIEKVEVRSVLTCEAKHGVCAKCYGRNLATGRMVEKGEAVGVIAAQSIGEPGTQLTLRTFHVGGVAGNVATENSYKSKVAGIIHFTELRTIVPDKANEDEKPYEIVVSRQTECTITDEATGAIRAQFDVPYASKLYVKDGEKIESGCKVCEWDPFNAVVVLEEAGQIVYENVIDGTSCRVEIDEATGLRETVIVESKDRMRLPVAHLMRGNDEIRSYNLPVGAHMVPKDGDEVHVGEFLFKIPRTAGKAGDITGGLPRVTELFEARNASNPAVVSDIDGIVSIGKVRRGLREVIVTPKMGDSVNFSIPLSKQILVQEGDFVRAGAPLCDGAITPDDILRIEGPIAVQNYIVQEVQGVYRLQGVKINDKHFEVIVRQMLRKVSVVNPGDSRFLEGQLVDKATFFAENARIYGKLVVVQAGDSQLRVGQIITPRKFKELNSSLRRQEKKLIECRAIVPAVAQQVLLGITRAALGTQSFISAASFQETNKVLNDAAINGRVDHLEGMKENVICGHLIPAGTGLREFEKLTVFNTEEVKRLAAEAPQETEQEQE